MLRADAKFDPVPRIRSRHPFSPVPLAVPGTHSFPLAFRFPLPVAVLLADFTLSISARTARIVHSLVPLSPYSLAHGGPATSFPVCSPLPLMHDSIVRLPFFSLPLLVWRTLITCRFCIRHHASCGTAVRFLISTAVFHRIAVTFFRPPTFFSD